MFSAGSILKFSKSPLPHNMSTHTAAGSCCFTHIIALSSHLVVLIQGLNIRQKRAARLDQSILQGQCTKQRFSTSGREKPHHPTSVFTLNVPGVGPLVTPWMGTLRGSKGSSQSGEEHNDWSAAQEELKLG